MLISGTNYFPLSLLGDEFRDYYIDGYENIYTAPSGSKNLALASGTSNQVTIKLRRYTRTSIVARAKAHPSYSLHLPAPTAGYVQGASTLTSALNGNVVFNEEVRQLLTKRGSVLAAFDPVAGSFELVKDANGRPRIFDTNGGLQAGPVRQELEVLALGNKGKTFVWLEVNSSVSAGGINWS